MYLCLVMVRHERMWGEKAKAKQLSANATDSVAHFSQTFVFVISQTFVFVIFEVRIPSQAGLPGLRQCN